MDTMISSGDHAVDGRGIPITLTGPREIIQRALIRLSVKKGAFGPDPELGSELFRLTRHSGEVRDRVAMGYVREALAVLPGLHVESVSCETREGDVLNIKIQAVIEGKSHTLEVNEAW